ncbi:MAG: gliding motility-associated ABC transporter ATP-binding subunit GldA [Cyclobacteriaceae bacterium]|nr:gliding motility-associated ABC transporter ATP-binding subunit GldA [Cyclobacteriaceae bacterium]
MSLQIQNLTKIYGQQKAVDAVSFTVKEGEIVGFLGPNGAGKSTTMKIATGYLPPTTGGVKVGGFDIKEQPLRVKKIIGYLPEHNPLYLDMYVHEYLNFVGGLYGLTGRTRKSRVEHIISLCGLTQEQNKKLESLSKGYRQRAGLAQALLHDPEVLILDEPTSGLDPNQIIEIRKVIKEVSRNKTVLFSSHIMQEVQALCDRVVIINKGKIVADDQLSSLLQDKGGGTLVVEFKEEVSINELKAIHGVADVTSLTAFKCKVHVRQGMDVRGELFKYASDQKRSLIELKVEEHSMESIFKELTSEEQEK